MTNTLRISFALAFVALLALTPLPAFADRGEVYLTLTLEPELVTYTEPIASSTRTTALGAGGAISLYYGFTNTLHFGGAVHFAGAQNIGFSDATVRLSDGSSSHGQVFDDRYGIGANALIAYRLDTGHSLAPVLRLEAGFTHLNYSNIQHTPAGTGYSLTFPNVSETVLELRAALLGEYRISDHFVASLGLAITGHPSSWTPWDVSLPITVGWIW